MTAREVRTFQVTVRSLDLDLWRAGSEPCVQSVRLASHPCALGPFDPTRKCSKVLRTHPQPHLCPFKIKYLEHMYMHVCILICMCVVVHLSNF